MKLWIASVTGFVLLAPQSSRADFKYTETTKITGGALGGLMKFASGVSGKGSGPHSATYCVEGNQMRVEQGDAEIEIIDLDARHIVRMDARKHTYVVLTFEEMRAQLEQFRQGRKADSGGQPQFTAKIKVKPTQNTRTILGQTAHEVQATIEMAASEQSHVTGNDALSLTSDMWLAPGVGGYDEVRNFFQRMMREMNWAPGESMGGDPRMAKALEEVRKNSSAASGFPLLASVEMKSAGNGTATPPRRESDDSADANIPTSIPTTGGDAANAALGGLLGLRKRKRDANERAAARNGDGPDQDGSALVRLTTEVASFSTSALDPATFEIPAGYRQVPNRKTGE
ncbi:MAG TPA: hypothetical protein VK525_21955 [Candidatus Saccharimonadales bacterium]|nr:hypothetical protein [Candidatus Saccharimonadales bacterium]